ncbi:MAG: DUF4290 domain-containing protein [Bacteroidaceae bacterium]|nr:DUF4290 domain-containing protein [Bacteroidaceae bacterium]MBQ2030278.1 DUF4290 domain-containing protein [Bacteroidaceae bacterium]
MDYNTDRELLILPEYGRTVQNMVDYAMTLTDRSERQRCAETIVDLMQHMFPIDMDASDARRVYWDHLARLSHYELDIDYPVEIIREDEATKKPSPLPYPMKTIERRHYGYLLEELMRRTGDMEPSQERDRLVELTANQMRKDLYYWNKDSLNEEKIADDFAHYTDGHVQLETGQVRYSGSVPNGNQTQRVQMRRRRNKQ